MLHREAAKTPQVSTAPSAMSDGAGDAIAMETIPLPLMTV